MDNNSLKNLLGDELYTQVMEKLGDTPFTLGEGKIPFDRFNEINAQKKTLETQVATLAAEIESLRSENHTLKATAAEKEVKFRINDILTKAGAKNAATVLKLLSLDDIQDTEESIAEVQTRVEALKKSDPYLFGGNVASGNVPDTSNLGGSSITREDFAKMSYSEKAALYERNKPLYDSLAKID